MATPHSGPAWRQPLLDYFLRGCKRPEQRRIGIELEKIGIDASLGTPLPYDGRRASVCSVLQGYQQLRGGRAVVEGKYLIGLRGDWGQLSIEPGGQIEWASPPCQDLATLDTLLNAHLQALTAVGASTGVRWLEVAVDPVHPVLQMHWMPRRRDHILKSYMARQGAFAHRTMTQTASIQCALDYGSPDDWRRMFRAIALWTPVAVACFANSSRVDGQESGYRCWRAVLWRETDPARCLLPALVFDADFDLERWVDWICNLPVILQRQGACLVPGSGRTFRQETEAGDSVIALEDWELHLSTVLTLVRSYTYLEIRGMDLQPDHRLPAVPAFWCGLLYDAEVLNSALELARSWDSFAAWQNALWSAARDGLAGHAGGVALGPLASRGLSLAAQGLRRWMGASTLPDPALPLERLARELGLSMA